LSQVFCGIFVRRFIRYNIGNPMEALMKPNEIKRMLYQKINICFKVRVIVRWLFY
jgi:hypothetical protein